MNRPKHCYPWAQKQTSKTLQCLHREIVPHLHSGHPEGVQVYAQRVQTSTYDRHTVQDRPCQCCVHGKLVTDHTQK